MPAAFTAFISSSYSLFPPFFLAPYSSNHRDRYIGAINSPTLILLIAMVVVGAADPARVLAPMGTIIERSNSFDVWIQCGCLKENPIPLIMLGYESILLIIGAMMAYLTKDVVVSFGESKWVAVSPSWDRMRGNELMCCLLIVYV